MKQIIVLLALAAGLISCHQPAQTENKTAVSNKPELKNSIWVNARYLTTLEQTKSPLKASAFADTVMISFDATADTANIVWNFHEASLHKVKQGEKIELYNAYEAKPEPEFILSLENGNLKVGKSVFQQVDTIGFVEKKFWIGRYTSGGKEIELKADNTIAGIDSLSGYRVWVDYVTTQTDIDLIDFTKKGSEQSTTYGYRFAGNELIFYRFNWTEDGVMGKAGKEVFRWKRRP